jgi:transposase-like protein
MAWLPRQSFTAEFREQAVKLVSDKKLTLPERDFPLELMCRVFEVSNSGYHAWLKRKPSKRSQETARLEVAIRAAHTRSRETGENLLPEIVGLESSGLGRMESRDIPAFVRPIMLR